MTERDRHRQTEAVRQRQREREIEIETKTLKNQYRKHSLFMDIHVLSVSSDTVM